MSQKSPREIEVKLDIDPADFTALKDKIVRASGPGITDKLVSVYYDTDKHALRHNGLSVRVRSFDGRWIQTVKATNGASVGLFDRLEWETETKDGQIDLAALARTPVGPLLSDAQFKLKPLFETRIERTVWLIESDRAAIEVALDVGKVVAGRKSQPLAELELELKRGQPGDLFALIGTLDDGPGLRTGVRAKSERGYALIAGKSPRAFKAESVALTKDMTAGAAIQAILHSCLRQFRLNEDGLAQTRAVEHLHQARVAMRRLRSALSVFKSVLADEKLDGLTTRLKDFSRQLGDARNIDVYLTQSVLPQAAKRPSDPGVAAFQHDMKTRREAAYDGIIETLKSKPFRTLMLDIVEWIETGPWLTDDGPLRKAWRDQPIRMFAGQVLDKNFRRLKKSGKHLQRLEPHDRHRVRIAGKKLRYTAEFVAGLATSRKAAERHATFLTALEALQGHLGDLNDIQTGHEIALGLTGAEPASATFQSPAAFAAAHVSGETDAKVEELLEKATEAHKALGTTKRFWAKWVR